MGFDDLFEKCTEQIDFQAFCCDFNTLQARALPLTERESAAEESLAEMKDFVAALEIIRFN